jgi:hypothetical protein
MGRWVGVFIVAMATTVVLTIAGCTFRYSVIAYDNRGTILEGYAIAKGVGEESPIMLAGGGLTCEGCLTSAPMEQISGIA